jgi:hypothetical protein
MSVKIEEGQMFTVPLNRQVHAVGVVARVHREGRRKIYGIFAYFFGTFEKASPIRFEQLKAVDAIMRLKCSVLYIHDGKWQIIGKVSNWKRESWPLPVFYRHDLLRGTVLVRFSDENLITPIEETSYQGGDIKLTDEDSTAGSLAVEIMLRQKLNISE